MHVIDTTYFPEYRKHKVVYEVENARSGLHAFIAIHTNDYGPAVGGTRMFPYKSKNEAVRDVLRLSRAMTFKCAIAGVPYGGGKGVIIGSPDRNKSKALLKAYAREVDKLKGAFYTGEDVGLAEDDVQIMLNESPYFIGKKGLAGDPSPYAALSTYLSMKVAAETIWGKGLSSGITVAVKGVGKVGRELVRLLYKDKVNVIVADKDRKQVAAIKKQFPKVEVTNYKYIHRLKVDIYSPCALGNEFTADSAEGVKAGIICGAANNQLESELIGDYFFKKGILYIPDYLANAGGLINVVDELEKGGYKRDRVLKRIRSLQKTVKGIIFTSRRQEKPANRIADSLAHDAIGKWRKSRLSKSKS